MAALPTNLNSSLFCSRRDAIRTAAVMALGAAPSLHRLNASDSRPSFSFLVVSDIHYRDERCAAWLERVVHRIRALRPRPDFCVLDGDLSESGTAAELGAVHRIFGSLRMPIHSVIGNHDCSQEGDTSAYQAIFGRELNYQFSHGGWQFLALDSTEGPRVFRATISQRTLAWTERALKQIPAQKPVAVLTHLPLGRNWLRPINAERLLERFDRHNLQAVLSGHWHGITERTDGAASLSTGRCCSWWRTNHDGSALKGFVLCEVEAGAITHRFIPVGA